jgi:hypothetical protein
MTVRIKPYEYPRTGTDPLVKVPTEVFHGKPGSWPQTGCSAYTTYMIHANIRNTQVKNTRQAAAPARLMGFSQIFDMQSAKTTTDKTRKTKLMTTKACVAMKYPRAFVSLNTGMKEVPEPTS